MRAPAQALSLLAAWAFVALAPPALAASPPWLDAAADDECAAAGGAFEEGACAFSALQRRASAGRETTLPETPAGDAIEPPVPEEDVVAQVEGGSEADRSHSSCPIVPYDGPEEGAASCFCHKVGNPQCAGKPCACREGCSGIVRQGSESTTIQNRAATSKCNAAYLTMPRAYFKNIADGREKCEGGFEALLTSMLIHGFTSYQSVHAGPVVQCFHKAHSVSVDWLHLHTFCAGGRIDGLPNHDTAYCANMTSPEAAAEIAHKFAKHR